MQTAHKYDKDYRWIPGEEIYVFPNAEGVYELPENYTFKELPQPNWKPKFNGDDWIETITDEELEEILHPPIPPIVKTEIELLQEKILELEDALLEITTISSYQEAGNNELESAVLELTEISSNQEVGNDELENALLEMSQIDAENATKVSENENGILETTILVGEMMI